MAGLDRLRGFLRIVPHEGYRDGEEPVYGDCQHGCGAILRIDRTDLIREHEHVCPALRAS